MPRASHRGIFLTGHGYKHRTISLYIITRELSRCPHLSFLFPGLLQRPCLPPAAAGKGEEARTPRAPARGGRPLPPRFFLTLQQPCFSSRAIYCSCFSPTRPPERKRGSGSNALPRRTPRPARGRPPPGPPLVASIQSPCFSSPRSLECN
jgi:hypothetical protein